MTAGASMPSAAILRGDCLALLREMPDDSVDAIVTDPPYGLSREPDMAEVLRHWLAGDEYSHGSVRKGPKNCLANIARGAVRDPDDPESEPGALGVNAPVAFRLVGIGVLWPVDLHHRKERGDEQIDGPEVAAVADDVLLDHDVASLAEHRGNHVLDLRPLDGAPACVGVCACFALCGSSRVSVPVLLRAVEPEGPAGEVAGAGAEVRAVLRLDLTGRTAELLPTGGAGDAEPRFALLLRTELVGARAGARRLPAETEPGGVGRVGDAAYPASPFDLAGGAAPDGRAALPGAGADPGLRRVELDAARLAFLLHPDVLQRLRNPTNAHGGFMGKTWDTLVPGPAVWRECLRVVKPGGHLVAFSSTRTEHLLGVALALAGWERRDTLHWAYWSGFPKSLDVSKAIDGLHGAEREVVGDKLDRPGYHLCGHGGNGETYGHGFGSSTPATRLASALITAPATPDAIRWQGYGTALKPAIEPALLCRKPLRESSIARQVLATGTGALNIGGTRYAFGDPAWPGPQENDYLGRPGNGSGAGSGVGAEVYGRRGGRDGSLSPGMDIGRFPANLYHCPKASRAERERGLDASVILCSCAEVEWDEADRQAPTPAGTASPTARATTWSMSPPSADTDSSTSSSGRPPTDPCRPATTSTTSTATSSTTTSPTLNACPSPTTGGSTPDGCAATDDGSSDAPTAATRSQSPASTGTSSATGGSSPGSAAPAISRTSSGESSTCARCGKRRSRSTGAQAVGRKEGSAGLNSPRAGSGRTADEVLCTHPTVKPVRLMRWLCRLLTPPGGLVVDPFVGSGTTAVAAALEGFRVVGCELDDHYAAIAEARLAHALRWPASWADTAPGADKGTQDDEPEALERAGQARLFGGGA